MLFIEGQWRPGSTVAVTDPATGEDIGRLAHAERADLDDARGVVARGFRPWSASGAFERYRIMRRVAELLRVHADTIAPIYGARSGQAAGRRAGRDLGRRRHYRLVRRRGQRTYGQIIPARAAGMMQMALKLPVGPVAAQVYSAICPPID